MDAKDKEIKRLRARVKSVEMWLEEVRRYLREMLVDARK